MLNRAMLVAALLLGSLLVFSNANESVNVFEQNFTVAAGKIIRLYSNRNLEHKNCTVTTLHVAIHGQKREPKQRVEAALKANGSEEILVVSPHFKTNGDNPDTNELRWSQHGWKIGNKSLHSNEQSSQEERISSFFVVDRIITEIIESGLYPNLSKIIVSGHSAGGQFTQRYALLSQLFDNYPNLKTLFMIFNASSYTYLNKMRLVDKKWIDLDTQKPHSFKKFNDYKYGLENVCAYGQAQGATDIRTRYLRRLVVIGLGLNDRDSNDPMLDKKQAAMLQGKNRLERALNYSSYLNRFYSPHNHSVISVFGVGHCAEKMYGSSEIKRVVKKFMQDSR